MRHIGAVKGKDLVNTVAETVAVLEANTLDNTRDDKEA